jgi:Flp pilus assembly CpaF family ATPase
MSRPENTTMESTLNHAAKRSGRANFADEVRARYLSERRDTADNVMVSRDDVARRVGRIVDESEPLLGTTERQRLVDAISAEIAGLGPLEPLLADPSITEVMVNRPDVVWVERTGRLQRIGCRISSEQIERYIERITGPLGLRIDRNTPYVDARLADGSRLHAVIPPLAVDGPSLTIRKFAAHDIPLSAFGNEPVVAFLGTAVAARKTILISGATGSGKTTLLAALCSMITDVERVVIIEETTELRVTTANVVRLEARLPTVEGRGEVTVRTLVRNALRMRPDRIVVGEVRGAEAFDMLQAMGTGHEGSLCTLHANSAEDALARTVSLTLLAGVGLPADAVERQVARSVDFVVHLERSPTGRRISEVVRVVFDERGLRGEPCEGFDGA